MFTEMLQAEVWRKRLEAAGFRVVADPWDPKGRDTAPPPAREERDGRTTRPGPVPILSPSP